MSLITGQFEDTENLRAFGRELENLRIEVMTSSALKGFPVSDYRRKQKRPFEEPVILKGEKLN